jgi:hypothetical protein
MKKSIIIRFMAILAALFLFSCPTWATPIPLITDPAYSQPANSGDNTIQSWLVGLITAYNSENSLSLPTDGIGAVPDLKVDKNFSAPFPYPPFGNDTLSINLPLNEYDYLVFHWGGSGGGTYEAFDLMTDRQLSYTFPAPGQNGLSWYSFYRPATSVPEPGTLMLLGFGLLALWAVSRRK